MLKLTNKYVFVTALVGMNLAAISIPFAVSADTQQPTTAVNLTVNPVISSYSTSGTVTLGTITPTASGTQSVNSDTVTAATNDTAGLTMTMQENSASSTSMVSGANNITASAGTTASPVALANNTWGWRIDTLAGFGSGPTSILSNAAPSALTYAGIPANGSPFTIKTTAATGSATSTVWYGARVNNAQPYGAYTTTILYTISTN